MTNRLVSHGASRAKSSCTTEFVVCCKVHTPACSLGCSSPCLSLPPTISLSLRPYPLCSAEAALSAFLPRCVASQSRLLSDHANFPLSPVPCSAPIHDLQIHIGMILARSYCCCLSWKLQSSGVVSARSALKPRWLTTHNPRCRFLLLKPQSFRIQTRSLDTHQYTYGKDPLR